MATRAIDPDIEQGPDDDPNAIADDGTESLDLIDDTDEEEEDEEDEPAAKAKSTKKSSVAELTAKLEAANKRAASTAAALTRERRIRKQAGVNSRGKQTNGAGAETKTDDPYAGMTDAQKRTMQQLERERDEAKANAETAAQARLDGAIDVELEASGLAIPKDATEKRRFLKKVRRMMDLDGVEIDSDGDLVGLDIELEVLRELAPGMFGTRVESVDGEGEPTVIARERAATTTVRPDAGNRKPATRATDRSYKSTAEYLMSPEYNKRHAPR